MDAINQDLVTSLSPIYYVSVFLGLVSSFYKGSFGNRSFIKGRFHWIYNIAYLTVHLIIIITAYLSKDKTKENSKFDPRIVLFNIYTSLFISLVVLICHHLFRFGIHKTVKEIYQLDKEMISFGIRIDNKGVFKNSFGITSFLIITAIWFSVITRESTKLYEFYYIILFGLEYMITMTMKSQFCILNIALRNRFIALDEKLKEVIESTRNNTEKTNNIIVVKSANKTNNTNDNLTPIASQIITLSEYHSKLYNMSKRMNLYYSIQILLITGKYFVEITATLYFNLRKFYKHDENDSKFGFYASAHFIWAVMNALDLLILVNACDSMCSAANNSKLTLHKVNLNSKDIEMKKEVTAFSLQLLHNDLILTAAGFFNIDFTLIFNIIGAVTTYLVIFIQFDISSQPPTTPPATTSLSSTTPNSLSTTLMELSTSSIFFDTSRMLDTEVPKLTE